MGLLFSKYLNPSTGESKFTGSVNGATPALDNGNLLRTQFTTPSSGKVLARISIGGQGSAVAASILLGFKKWSDGSDVVTSLPKVSHPGGSTSVYHYEALFVIEGLTPGAAQDWYPFYTTIVGETGTNLVFGGTVGSGTAKGPVGVEIWSTT